MLCYNDIIRLIEKSFGKGARNIYIRVEQLADGQKSLFHMDSDLSSIPTIIDGEHARFDASDLKDLYTHYEFKGKKVQIGGNAKHMNLCIPL